jgi:hypothetical protein
MVAEGIEVIKIGTKLVFFRCRKRDQGNLRLAGGVGAGKRADELNLGAAFVDRIDAA